MLRTWVVDELVVALLGALAEISKHVGCSKAAIHFGVFLALTVQVHHWCEEQRQNGKHICQNLHHLEVALYAVSKVVERIWVLLRLLSLQLFLLHFVSYTFLELLLSVSNRVGSIILLVVTIESIVEVFVLL